MIIPPAPPIYLSSVFYMSAILFLLIEGIRDIRKRMIDERNVTYLNGIVTVIIVAAGALHGAVLYPLLVLLCGIILSLVLMPLMRFSSTDSSFFRVLLVGLTLINPYKGVFFFVSVLVVFAIINVRAIWTKKLNATFPAVPFLFGGFVLSMIAI